MALAFAKKNITLSDFQEVFSLADSFSLSHVLVNI